MYDNNSDAFGFIYNSTEYYYVKNAQKDVTAIADSNGNVLARYYYDAWGKVREITGNTEIAGLNPIRYRSYYYDAETGWYYLNTRYYSADMCRFINSDDESLTTSSPAAFTDKNLFAYCDNNSIVRIDDGGDFWHIVIGSVVGGVIGGISTALTGGDATAILISATAGAISGGLACSVVSLGTIIVVNSVISASESILSQGASKGFNNIDYGEVAIDTVIGGAVSAIGGKGTGTKHLTKLGKQTVKRTVNTTTHKGIKAGVHEAGKAFSYYTKNTKNYYHSFRRSTLFDSIITVANSLFKKYFKR